MFIINLNWTQLLAGTSKPIMSSKTPIQYITSTWFKEITEFLSFINASIKIPQCWTPTTKRENDVVIMDKVNKLQISNSNRNIFNNWRLFFQVDSIADITNNYGDRIHVLNWPQQQMPSDKSFSIWVSILRQITNCEKGKCIQNKLGKWTCNPSAFRQYDVLINSNSTCLIKKEADTWWKYDMSHEVRSKIYFTKKSRCSHAETNNFMNYYPVEIKENNLFYFISERYQLEAEAKFKIGGQVHNIVTCFNDYINSKHNRFHQMFQYTTIIDEAFLKDQQYAMINLCCDGGAKLQQGSIGIVLQCNQRIVMRISSRIPEGYEDPNSHRCECFGLLMSVHLISLIQDYIKLVHKQILCPQSIHVYCDNKSSVDTINKLQRRKITLKEQWSANMDLIQYTIFVMQNIRNNNGTINISYIEGYQDRNNNRVHGMAVLNVEADKCATIGLNKTKVKQLRLPTDKAILIMQGKKVSANYKSHLRDIFSATQLHEYYTQKYSWSHETIKNIWWDAHGLAIESFGAGQRATALKIIHGRIACNKRESVYYKFRSPLCYTCGVDIEDTCHIIQCKKCPERQKLRRKFVMELRDKLTILGTNADTIQILTTHVSAWLNQTKFQNVQEMVPDASKHLICAATEQHNIGWHQWFRGRITNTWGDIYFNDILIPNNLVKFPSVQRWGKEVIKLTLKFVMDCWYVRNTKEHESIDNPIGRAKDKIVDEILWVLDLIKGEVPSQFNDLVKDELIMLPKDNLNMMLEQLKRLQKSE
jgi:hypothetical protein